MADTRGARQDRQLRSILSVPTTRREELDAVRLGYAYADDFPDEQSPHCHGRHAVPDLDVRVRRGEEWGWISAEDLLEARQ